MKAKYLVQRYAYSLIGKTVLTERIGEWPGGDAEVIALQPDPKAPEIVMQVRHKSKADPLEPSRLWEMGVFEHENVELHPDKL